jgi:hypothetical protein
MAPPLQKRERFISGLCGTADTRGPGICDSQAGILSARRGEGRAKSSGGQELEELASGEGGFHGISERRSCFTGKTSMVFIA